MSKSNFSEIKVTESWEAESDPESWLKFYGELAWPSVKPDAGKLLVRLFNFSPAGELALGRADQHNLVRSACCADLHIATSTCEAGDHGVSQAIWQGLGEGGGQ